ncbi:hypothetical protein [Limibacillus halophilus]|uniref:Uncharacterized protein n=1 Tax=Limibacillus halophilus TaxID=1579333 RepID=A0A839SY59_9PROT|nr:hypothetical protein [Limibacillus halophilus]MBB3066476.1 hypothetical protein [Limibacillus halophilus]
MAEEEHRLHRHITRGEHITGPNPELDTALEAKGSYVAFNGEITPFHFWMSEPYPYQHPGYPDSGTEEGRAAIRARHSEFVDREVNALWDSRKKNTEDAQKAMSGKRPATEPKQ